MHCLFLCCLLLSVLAQSAGGSKILVFSPTVSRSHMISNGRVADALASDGHDVVSSGDSILLSENA
jgi:glucuronosyltransferase